MLAPVAVDRSPSPPRAWAKTAGSPQVHVSDARGSTGWPAPSAGVTTVEPGPHHRGPRLVSDEVGPTLAVPLHGLRGTVSTHTGTAYSGLRCARRECDQVASLRVEGVSISATARGPGHARHTIARWLERASTAAKRFHQRMLREFAIIELQADELCAFIGTKSRATWLCAAIEVCSRLWAGSVLGRRASRNATAVLNDVILRGRVVGCPLIATDGFEYDVGVSERHLWGGVRLGSRAQDSAERSRRPSRTAPEDRPGGSAAGCAVGVGGFRDPAHLVRRASHPHDSPRLGVRAPSLALPRPWRRPAPRVRRPLARLWVSNSEFGR